jgi:hypothetical protein
MQVTSRFGRASPHPRLGSVIELRGGDLHRSLDLTGRGLALTSEGIATKQAPPALLQIEPACSLGDEHVLEARVLCEPGTRLLALLATQIVGNDEKVAGWIVRFDVLEQLDGGLGIARRRTSGHFFTVAHPQRPIDPHLVITTAVLQWGFNAVAVGRPTGSWRKGARDHRSEFVGTDGRRSRWRLGIVGDDRGSFGTKSLSSLVPQLWVRRQRLPSRR